MDIKELRIGNLVWLHTDSSRYIDTITVNAFAEIDNGIKIVSPIFITKDWMLKCGFEFFPSHAGGYGKWKNELLELVAKEDITDMYIWNGNSINIRHIHHLQNLHKFLTGVELQISY